MKLVQQLVLRRQIALENAEKIAGHMSIHGRYADPAAVIARIKATKPPEHSQEQTRADVIRDRVTERVANRASYDDLRSVANVAGEFRASWGKGRSLAEIPNGTVAHALGFGASDHEIASCVGRFVGAGFEFAEGDLAAIALEVERHWETLRQHVE